MTRPPSADDQTYSPEDDMNRSDRRRQATTYRRVDVGPVTCSRCDANLGATFVIERGEPEPAVTFLHLADGSHEPVIAGRGMAARARREGRVIGAAQTEGRPQ